MAKSLTTVQRTTTTTIPSPLSSPPLPNLPLRPLPRPLLNLLPRQRIRNPLLNLITRLLLRLPIHLHPHRPPHLHPPLLQTINIQRPQPAPHRHHRHAQHIYRRHVQRLDRFQGAVDLGHFFHRLAGGGGFGGVLLREGLGG